MPAFWGLAAVVEHNKKAGSADFPETGTMISVPTYQRRTISIGYHGGNEEKLYRVELRHELNRPASLNYAVRRYRKRLNLHLLARPARANNGRTCTG